MAALASLGFIDQALAQSTASQLEEVVVTSTRKQASVNGIMVAETAGKARSSVTQEFIATQPIGQTIVQTLNLTPGLNFTNNDPYGSSGGNIRLRGFDGNRVSLTFDGIPLNDTGNYAVFTNQQLDPELIERANVNLGTTDVDSPTASATGGTINYLTRKPAEAFGGLLTLAGGSNSYQRALGLLDTGKFGRWGTSAFFAASHQSYDKFKGLGDLRKNQYNLRLYQPVGDDSFVSLAAHYNENRNNNIRTLTLAQFQTNGPHFDFDATCTRPSFPGTNGVADNDASSTVPTGGGPAPSACSNYYGRQINPSNTGNIRLQSSWHLTDALRLTVDPSFQYVLADGGTQTDTISEKDKRIIGTATVTGADLNGDGDTLDTVRFFAPSVTNTHRFGGTSSLIWDINPDHRVRVAYTVDRGRHRQSGEWTYLEANGDTENVFGGKRGRKVFGADGSFLRSRDRYSIADLKQAAVEYRGQFFDSKLTLSAGVRSPHFTRDLNQYCYSQNGSSNVRCTTEAPNATLANGNVTFTATGSTQFIKPYTAEKKYSKTMPNVGLTYKLSDAAALFVSYAEGLSAPRTDNLYTVTRLADGSLANPYVQPETTRSVDVGYRYSDGRLIGAMSLWSTAYANRIVSSFDDVLGVFVDRNVGSVDQGGLDGQIGFQQSEKFTWYASVSYSHSKVKANIPVSLTASLPTAGKQLVETPKWTFGGRLEYRPLPQWRLGLQGKQVGSRFSTDVNDEQVPGYALADFDASYEFTAFGGKTWSAQLNVTNLFDKVYLGSISSRNNAITIPGVQAGSSPTYNVGAPRTLQVSLRAQF
ncbi:MAG: TonB-dependent receptor [Steroidobacteraceae bacterium]